VNESVPRIQRIAAYNVCLDASSRLLMCRLSDITERPGSWTLPGGGIDFGEHPEAGALRELHEETGLTGRIVELLAVDSIQRTLRGVERGRLGLEDRGEVDYHAVRIVYRTEITGGELRNETDESTDQAAWRSRDDVAALPLVELGRLGVELAFGTTTESR
jgi:ADP-ribose pyrophosphatase YjhB (NUDIX family)